MEKVTQRQVPAGAPISVPPGAVTSPFAMARVYAGDRLDLDREDTEAPAVPAQEEQPVMNTKASGPGSRGPQLVTRAKETLKACGPLSLDQFAEGLGIDRKKAAILARNGAQRKLWKREQHPDGEKLVLIEPPTTAAASGFKRHLAKKAGAVPAKPRKAVSKAALPAPMPIVPIEEEEGQFGLFNNGEFRIEYAGQEMRLPRKVTRAMVAYLLKIDAALEEAA